MSMKTCHFPPLFHAAPAMRYCLNASTIKPAPLLEKIRVAGAAGYDGIELWVVELYEHVGRGGEISDVENSLADHGLAEACQRQPALIGGINVMDGRLTSKVVADAHGLPFASAQL